uniref:Uncharacterized protein n=1 Tax=Pithovirus LCPAC201 TaxID=2506591 RepID=A0A481Z568_9VIRU|nr:MAG: hypothetical protein LCPAC201_03250 [Pithovirus LCPAC201]
MKKCFHSCQTIYLSPKGCDNNSGDDPKCPKRSFDAALKAVQHCRSAEIKMKRGTYKWSKLKIRGPSKLRVSGKLKLVAKKLKVTHVDIGVSKAIIKVCDSSGIKIGDIVSLVKNVEGLLGEPVVSIDGNSLTIVFPKNFKAAIFDCGINVLRPASILKLPSKPTEITSCQTSVDWIGVRLEGFLESEDFETGSVMKLRSCDWSFTRSSITKFIISLSNSSFIVTSCVLRDINLPGNPFETGSRTNLQFSLILDFFVINAGLGTVSLTVCTFIPDFTAELQIQFISLFLGSLVLSELCNAPGIGLLNCKFFTFNISLFKSNQLLLENCNWTHEGLLEIVGADIPIIALTTKIQLDGSEWLLKGVRRGLFLAGSKMIGIESAPSSPSTIVVTSTEESLIVCDCSQICGNITFGSSLDQLKPSFELRNNSHVSLPEGSVDGFKPKVGLPLLFTNLGPKDYPIPGKFMEDRINQAEGTGVGDLSSFTISKAVPVLALKRPRLSVFGRRAAKKE